MDPELLLAHSGFVHALARSLVMDENTAADIEQQTWMAALEHPPAPGRPIRPWLSKVVVNFARLMYRGEKNRTLREKAVSVSDKVISTEELVARGEARQRLIETVLTLSEPYRSVILLRFYEDLPPRKIAKKYDLPVETVRTRIKKGLEKLRLRLDSKYGGHRDRWRMAVAPLAYMSLTETVGATTGLTSVLQGVSIMTLKWKIVAAAILVIGLSLGLWSRYSLDDNRATVFQASDELIPGSADQMAKNSVKEEKKKGLDLLDSDEGGKFVSNKQAIESRGAAVDGTVIDENGNSVSGAGVFLLEEGMDPLMIAESGAKGKYASKKLTPGSYTIYAQTKAGLKSILLALDLRTGDEVSVDLKVGLFFDISGRVISSNDGEPIAGAIITASGIGDPEKYEAKSLKDGTYILQGLSKTSFLMNVSADRFGAVYSEGVIAGETGVDFILVRPGMLTGAVTVAKKGIPLKKFDIELVPVEYHMRNKRPGNISFGALFRCYYHKQTIAFEKVYSFESEDGAFEINGLSLGSYYVAVSSDGYILWESSSYVTIEPDKETLLNVELNKACSIVGVVKDSDTGLPVRSASVISTARGSSLADDPLLKKRCAVTDNIGRFDFNYAWPGNNIIQINHKDYLAKNVLVTAGMDMNAYKAGSDNKEEPLEISIDRKSKSGAIKVTVWPDMLASGDVAPLVVVIGAFGYIVKSLDDSGESVFDSLPLTRYSVMLTINDSLAGNKDVELHLEGIVEEVAFGALHSQTVNITGVVNADGAPYGGEVAAVLEITNEQGVLERRISSVNNGVFKMDKLNPGSGELKVYISGSGAFYSKKTTFGDTPEISFLLDIPGSGLRLKVCDAETNKGLSNAQVNMDVESTLCGDFKSYLLSPAITDAGGVIDQKLMPPGVYKINISYKGYKPLTKEVVLPANEFITLELLLYK